MDKNKIRFLGRHTVKDNKEYFSFSGAGFEFVVNPTKPLCDITLSFISELRECDFHYVAIYFNDVYHSKEKLGTGVGKIKLHLKEKTRIKVVKENEVYISALYLDDIALDGGELEELEPMKKEIIGFFGDSLTCGYGLLDFKGDEFKTETEEFSKSYANLASFSLNMDYLVVARSGISVAIPIYCDKLFMEIYDTIDMYKKCELGRKLDYASFNLGTNDCSGYVVSKEEDKPSLMQKFISEYIRIVEIVIKDNPGVKILICYNFVEVIDEFISAVKEVYEYISSHYENKCLLVKMEPNADGANCHPYYPAHERAAEILIEAIKSL